MKKVLFPYYFCGLVPLFYITFISLSSPGAFAEPVAVLEQLKKQDVERAQKYESLKNTKVLRVPSRTAQAALQTVLVDTDDDGMPDSWESAYGLNPNDPDDAWFDPDGDEVVNLFEYQLGSDLNNPSTPAVVTVAPSGADYTDVETAIDSVASGTVIRVAGGLYPLNYITFSPKALMIQGGWSPDFSQRDLRQHPTTFDGEVRNEILYFSVSSGEAVIVLDGLQFINGKGSFGAINLLASGTCLMKTSILNCSITSSESDFEFGGVLYVNNWDTTQSDRTIANTVIAGNKATGIKAHITGDAIAHWRIINATISHNLNAGGDNGYGIDVFTLGNGGLTSHIYNSILWGNEQEDINIWGSISLQADHSDIDKADARYGAIYQPGLGVLNVDPLFVAPENKDFHLQSLSPLIDMGVSQGVPLIDFEGDPRVSGVLADIGADELFEVVTSAGPDQIVFDSVMLNGSISSSPGGTIISWEWSLEHRTNSSFNRAATGQNPTLTDLAPGFYDVILTVTDNAGAIGKDTMLLAASGKCTGTLDIDGDGKLGLEEIVYILQVLTGIRPGN